MLGKLREAASVALERLAEGFEGFDGFEGGQRTQLPWKGLRKGLKHCLGRVAARVAMERRAGSCESCLGKACGRV